MYLTRFRQEKYSGNQTNTRKFPLMLSGYSIRPTKSTLSLRLQVATQGGILCDVMMNMFSAVLQVATQLGILCDVMMNMFIAVL